MTRDDLVKKADECLENMINDHEKAGVKRDWNRITGARKSKNDVIRDGTAHLQFLNTVAEAKGWDSVWHEEEQVELKGSVK